jgi:uncharacterized membrane protein YqjE
MADNQEYFLIEHILLTLGIIGMPVIVPNIAYICLTISLVLFAPQLLENYISKMKGVVKCVLVALSLLPVLKRLHKKEHSTFLTTTKLKKDAKTRVLEEQLSMSIQTVSVSKEGVSS